MLPTGTITFLMTDIEGSTALVERLGEGWDGVVARQRAIVRDAVRDAGGEEIDARGEEVFAAFTYASRAAAAAREIQRSVAQEQWPPGATVRVRIGLHTGEPRLSDEGYLGIDVHIVARVCAAAHGGQVLLSRVTAELLEPDATVELGEHQLRGITRSTVIFQLVGDEPGRRYPPLRAPRRDTGLVEDRELELAEAALAAVRPPGRVARALRHGRPRGLADLAWEARARRWRASPDLRQGFTDAASVLLVAARAAADADRLLARTDHRALTRRLSDYRELAVVSRAAETEVANVQRQLTLLEQVRQARASLARAHEGVAEIVPAAAPTREGLDSAVEPVRTAAHALDALADEAQSALGDSAMRLRRTTARGVYRLGDLYAVPYIDSIGIDRIRRFDSRSQAKAFAYSLRVIAKARAEYTGPSWHGADSSGWGGS